MTQSAVAEIVVKCVPHESMSCSFAVIPVTDELLTVAATRAIYDAFEENNPQAVVESVQVRGYECHFHDAVDAHGCSIAEDDLSESRLVAEGNRQFRFITVDFEGEQEFSTIPIPYETLCEIHRLTSSPT